MAATRRCMLGENGLRACVGVLVRQLDLNIAIWWAVILRQLDLNIAILALRTDEDINYRMP
jgi:hypothetical protein